MRRSSSLFLLSLVVLWSGFALPSPSAAQGRLVEDEITSPSLEGNLLGDPATRKMMIYLPPGYDDTDKRYPVVYLLHGFLGNYTFFAWSMNLFAQGMGLDLGLEIQAIADSLIAAGKMQEMIVVTPDGLTSYGGCWYEDSPVIGNYREYITQDLIAYIDGKYRTLPSRESRGISGHSMGGFGALSLAMERPDLFGAVAALSPGDPNDFSLPPTPVDEFIAQNPDTLGKPILLDPSQDTETLLPIAGEIFATSFATNGFYALASAFTPNSDNPPYYVDLPVQYPDKRLVEEVWEQWLQKDLVHQIAARGANLAGTPVFVDQGTGPVVMMTEVSHVDRVVQALEGAGVEVTYEEVPGDHLTHLREQVASALEFLSAHLGPGATSVSSSSWGDIKASVQK